MCARKSARLFSRERFIDETWAFILAAFSRFCYVELAKANHLEQGVTIWENEVRRIIDLHLPTWESSLKRTADLTGLMPSGQQFGISEATLPGLGQ